MNQFFFLLNEERRGFNPPTPGRSCKDIVVSGIPVKSGEYWIDPENRGNPFKVFCDMSTNGGTCDLVMMTKTHSDSCRPISSNDTNRERRGDSPTPFRSVVYMHGRSHPYCARFSRHQRARMSASTYTTKEIPIKLSLK